MVLCGRCGPAHSSGRHSVWSRDQERPRLEENSRLTLVGKNKSTYHIKISPFDKSFAAVPSGPGQTNLMKHRTCWQAGKSRSRGWWRTEQHACGWQAAQGAAACNPWPTRDDQRRRVTAAPNRTGWLVFAAQMEAQLIPQQESGKQDVRARQERLSPLLNTLGLKREKSRKKSL